MRLPRSSARSAFQPHFVLAIWGRETAYGAHKVLPHYAIQVLANEAYLGRRKDMFRNELLHALKMLEAGVITRDKMKSSWAGAMGLTQFMPSEYFTTAYDLDGDGTKDIWNSVPDALASAANQLKQKGWVRGQSWGYEVRLPKSMSCRMEGPDNAKTVQQWIELGVVRTGGAAFPKHAPGPAGIHSFARRCAWTRIPSARELHGDQALQHVRSLCAVRRQPRRPHRGRKRPSIPRGRT